LPHARLQSASLGIAIGDPRQWSRTGDQMAGPPALLSHSAALT
jgi:hypothetical protein